jgi:hypothetical protein
MMNTRGMGRAYLAKGGRTPAWQRKEGKDPSGGLNRKGVMSYRRENPGSKLQTAVKKFLRTNDRYEEKINIC